MVGFIHIIAFKYKADLPDEEKTKFEQTFMAMNTKCIKDGKPYVTVKGGKNIFPHPPAHEMNSVFIVEYESTEDQQYWHDTDEFHLAFIPYAQSITVDAVILDFAPF